jgi:hypothetical protein
LKQVISEGLQMPERLFLAYLAGFALLPQFASALGPPCSNTAAAKKSEQRKQQIELQLRSPISLSIEDVPLSQVLEEIRIIAAINIDIDMLALQEMGISQENKISIRVDDISLKSALSLILRKVGLRYVLWDEVLLITTENVAREKFAVATYKVTDLLSIMTEKRLMQLITLIAPCSWSECGGAGTVKYSEKTGRLLINQTQDIHEEIGYLLTILREILEIKREASPQIKHVVPTGPRSQVCPRHLWSRQ